ncbi:MAG: bifunctional DNA-formamidopyrimidine glycosylase/DNA-(apurinic or apyrimidinic site) lyase [Terracidiphilus sp.]
MPELPEVETIARGVNLRVRGDRILEVWFGGKREPFKTPATRQARGLEGRTILTVHRAGKHIVCELGTAEECVQSHPRSPRQAEIARRGPRNRKNKDAARVGHPDAGVTERDGAPSAQWIVHLGMTGRLLVTTPDASVAPHTHARLSLASGLELRFVDPRRFGRLEFRELSRNTGFLAPGADPLSVTATEFAQLFHGRRLAIKAALLNQKLLAGVGNIYADESLFRAGIRPRRLAGRLTRTELEGLRLALGEVLRDAIRLGGSSVSDYVDAEGERGFFQLEHCVYQRTGLPCLRCQMPIRRVVLAGRGTHYCPQCQR